MHSWGEVVVLPLILATIKYTFKKAIFNLSIAFFINSNLLLNVDFNKYDNAINITIPILSLLFFNNIFDFNQKKNYLQNRQQRKNIMSKTIDFLEKLTIKEVGEVVVSLINLLNKPYYYSYVYDFFAT